MRQRIFRTAPVRSRPGGAAARRIYILPTRRGWRVHRDAGDDAARVAQLRAVAGRSSSTFLLAGPRGRRAAAHVSQSCRHRDRAARRGRDVRRRRRCRSRWRSPGAPATRNAITLARPAVAAVDGRHRCRTRRCPSRSSCRRRARGRVALGRVTLSSDYPLGLWRGWAYVHFPLAGIVFPAPEVGAPPLPAGARRRTIRRRSRAATTPISRACASISAAIRCSASHGRRSRAAPAGTRSNSKAAAAAGPSTLAWRALPPALDAEAQHRAADRVGARGRARGAAVRAAAARHALAGRTGARSPPRRADGARADSRRRSS